MTQPRQHGIRPATQVRVVDYLLGLGLAIDQPWGKDRCTPLFESVARARNPRLVRFLIEHGASVANAPGGGLFAAAWWDDVDNLALLVGAGARVDVVVGVTPFLAAWHLQHFAAAKFLATHGADVNYQDRKGRTALHLGIEREYAPRLLRWLVQHGASPDVRDRHGITPRDRASRKRDKRFVAALSTREPPDATA
jgi:ankyrin repeat protein